MGIGCSDKGKLVLLDDTKVSYTNFSSHFLFQKHHQGEFKAKALKSVLINKNADINLETITEPIYYSDEETIKKVLEPLDIIISTFDNYRVKIFFIF